jgi:hypothetical protein
MERSQAQCSPMEKGGRLAAPGSPRLFPALFPALSPALFPAFGPALDPEERGDPA